EGMTGSAGSLCWSDSSVLIRAHDRAVDLAQELIPDPLRDRVLDEVDRAVAKSDVDAARMHAATLPAAVVHASAAVEAHGLEGRGGNQGTEDRSVLRLVTAIVTVGEREAILVVGGRIIDLGVTAETRHPQADGPGAANVHRVEPHSEFANERGIGQSVGDR